MRNEQPKPVDPRRTDKAPKQPAQPTSDKKDKPHGEGTRRPPQITDYASL